MKGPRHFKRSANIATMTVETLINREKKHVVKLDRSLTGEDYGGDIGRYCMQLSGSA